MRNLDMVAALRAQDIIKATAGQKKSEVENVVTKALGVIQEQGIYAGMLYLLSRPEKEKPIAGAARNQLFALLNDEALKKFSVSYAGDPAKDSSHDLLNHLANNVCSRPISTLLLIKNLFEQTLMYARYSAKARPDDKKDDKKKDSPNNNEQAQEN